MLEQKISLVIARLIFLKNIKSIHEQCELKFVRFLWKITFPPFHLAGEDNKE